MLNTTSKPIVCRSTSSSVQAWWSERDRNAALSLSVRILVNALMGSSIAGRTPWRKYQLTFQRTPLNCKWNHTMSCSIHCVPTPCLKFISLSSSVLSRAQMNTRFSCKYSIFRFLYLFRTCNCYVQKKMRKLSSLKFFLIAEIDEVVVSLYISINRNVFIQ